VWRPSMTSNLEKPKKNASLRSISVTRTASESVSDRRVASSRPANPAPRIRTCRLMRPDPMSSCGPRSRAAPVVDPVAGRVEPDRAHHGRRLVDDVLVDVVVDRHGDRAAVTEADGHAGDAVGDERDLAHGRAGPVGGRIALRGAR